MALSPSDPYYRAEVVPASIEAMAAPLCQAYGVGADAFGDKGNVYHDYGYHRSREWILNSPDSRYGSGDYSVQAGRDRGGARDNVSAFDFTPGEWGSSDNRRKMIELTKRMRAAARAYDPRLADLREIAGTEDGVHVVTFKAQGGGDLDPFDPTHLDHLHGSFWRDGAANDHRGIVDVMLGLGAHTEDDVSFIINADRTNVPVPGGAGRRRWAFVVTNDTGFGNAVAPPYALRLYAKPYGGPWTPIRQADILAGGVLAGDVVQLNSGETLSWALPDDTRNVSVRRMPLSTVHADGATGAPAGSPVTYDGPLSGTLEPLS